MNELIKIKTNENLEPIISLRELHNKLEITERYSSWTDRMFKYGFTENIDYIGCKVFNTLANQELQDHTIKLDMAKEICMLQRNEIGKQFRKYFIQVEKEFNSPEKIMARAVLIADRKVNTLTIEVKELKDKIESNKHRVSFAETIEKSSDCILIREFSKLLANEHIYIGEKKLYQRLREWGYILQKRTEPTQRAVEQGLFKINERLISTVKGDMLVKTTLITGKGQLFLLDKFKKEN